MTENINNPIKLKLPEDVTQIMEKDAELFQITKANGSINLNLLYNIVFSNYQNTFKEQNDFMFAQIKKITNKDSASLSVETIESITELLENAQIDNVNKSNKVTKSINYNKENIYQLSDFLDSFTRKNNSISHCLRRLYCSYTKLALNQRERIVFKENVDKILKSISENKQLKIIHKNTTRVISPYALAPSKEELYNYLLCVEHKEGDKEHDKPRLLSLRLTYIEHVTPLNTERAITENEEECLQLTKSHNPEFCFQEKDSFVKVLLTEEGINMLKKIYTHRPELIDIDEKNHIYTFFCPKKQAMLYFTKFHQDALIIEPLSLCKQIKGMYYSSSRYYQSYIDGGLEGYYSNVEYVKKLKQEKNQRNKTFNNIHRTKAF